MNNRNHKNYLADEKPRTLKDGVTPRPRNLSDAIEALEALTSKTTQTNTLSSEVTALTKERDELKSKVSSQQTSIKTMLWVANKEREQQSETPETLSKQMLAEHDPKKLYALYLKYKELAKRK